MRREVTLTLDTFEKTYTLESADTHYSARVEALGKFLEEFHIPGRPIDYITGRKKGLIGIVVRSAVDRRTLSRGSEPGGEYYVEQVSKLRQLVRTSSLFTPERKTKATGLLLQLEEVFSG